MYINKYEEFINEYYNRNINGFTKTRTDEISKEEFIEVLKNECSNFDVYNSMYLYRGSNYVGDYLTMDPTKFSRGSIEGIDIHTFLMDNLPSWSQYPKRSNSIISSTSRGSTTAFGNTTYIVIPYNDVNIAISPDSDVWKSFANHGIINDFNLNHDFNFTDYTDRSFFLKFNKFLVDSGMSLVMKKDTRKYNYNFETFKSFITDYFDPIENEKHRESIIRNPDIFNLFKHIDFNIDKPEDLTGDLLWKMIEIIFDPKDKGFEHLKYTKNFNISGYHIENGKSLWVGGKSLLIKEKVFKELRSSLL